MGADIKSNEKIKILEKKSERELKVLRSLELKNKKVLDEMKLLRKQVKDVSVKQSNLFVSEFKKQVLTLSIAAMSFIAALSWRDVINAWLAPILKNRNGLVEYLVVAMIVTILAVVIPVLLNRFLGEKEKTDKP
ncbi:MAG: DUF5654 family protein [Candidatus ainarchaeum sp.]|nr:DUF5654 family protein [Candidatus ainarchaeum sp.]